MLVCGIASATTVMSFDEMQHQPAELVDNYYNGGCSSSYSGSGITCGGPNYGVVWSSALAGGAPNGLWGNVANEPSGPNVMGFLDANSAIMNVAAGFDTGFSFYYAAPNTAGSITVYDGLNDSGNILATLFLPINGGNCDGFAQTYSCWSPIGVTFAGIAKSVNFGGVADFIVFDNVTIGSNTPGGGNGNNVSEPATLGMFGLGMLLIGLFAGVRRRVS
ncbi:hypothetical protein RHOFW104T7_09625 [Rhodanobacter thiooxydans]|uniref:Ice-binding protein C-terminal domain-containing protein n=2 Tax=Rhodanobacter thiooxydans TaxID=416169 RepID=A0A154QJ81_9GAMM|nr:hypothetical protein UUA_02421 [Rhodanobacter thiooxydans LCS2]KZC24224.1 hypothetical protein RHOFW104T7_09625 [Rhodanobacter thiooxydans]